MANGAVSVAGPGVMLGVGLGGFVDGIVLHQILQWHHLLSERGYAMKVQIAADGFFHGLTWIAVLVGLLWLWQRTRLAGRRPWAALLGPMLAGWGAFNLVEGIINHHLLGLHHVRSGPGQLWWDLAFLALGVLLLIGGVYLHRRSRAVGEREFGAASSGYDQ
jgi:uncharacterized membrane protein